MTTLGKKDIKQTKCDLCVSLAVVPVVLGLGILAPINFIIEPGKECAPRRCWLDTRAHRLAHVFKILSGNLGVLDVKSLRWFKETRQESMDLYGSCHPIFLEFSTSFWIIQGQTVWQHHRAAVKKGKDLHRLEPGKCAWSTTWRQWWEWLAHAAVKRWNVGGRNEFYWTTIGMQPPVGCQSPCLAGLLHMAFSGDSPSNQEPFQALSEFDRTWKKIAYHLHWYVFCLVRPSIFCMKKTTQERGKTKADRKSTVKEGWPVWD